MAARAYVDDVLKTGGQREYAIADLGTGFSNITENQDALEVLGSTFGEANAMGDMVLECDVSVASNVVTISHPSGEPHQFWFVAPKDYVASDIYMFQQGSNTPVTISVVNAAGESLADGAWVSGVPVTLARQGTQAFFTVGLPTTGGTLTGPVQAANVGLAVKAIRNIYIGTSETFPSGAGIGDVLLVYST